MEFPKKKPNWSVSDYVFLVLVGLSLVGISMKWPFIGILIVLYIIHSWFTGFKKIVVEDKGISIYYRFVVRKIKWEAVKRLEATFTHGGGTYYIYHGKNKDWFIKDIEEYDMLVRIIEQNTGKKFIRV